MRTPNATEHHLSYDNEFLPGWPGVADRRTLRIRQSWRAIPGDDENYVYAIALP
jgi:hypothetical protein